MRMSVFGGPLVLAFVALGSVVSLAQVLKVSEQNGHVSPVRARITFQNDVSREVVISAIGFAGFGDSLYTHTFFIKTDGGASNRTLWIDSIAAIKDLETIRTTRSEFSVVLKSGSQVSAMFVGAPPGSNCNEGKEPTDPTRVCSSLVISNQDEGREVIDIRKLKAIEFLPVAKKDKAGNMMFDTWRYSPFTGEKLQPK
jgi:hypothetical protein